MNGESLMGNFVCDAMLNHMQTDFAFITYGEIYGDLFKGEITRLDIFRLVPFDRTLIIAEISGDTLKQIIEKTLGGVHPGLAISGGKVEYDPNRPAQNRLTFAQVGEYPLYPKKIYRVITIDYLADGSTGFDLLSEPEQKRIFKTGILLRDLLIDHIKQSSPLDRTKISIDNRWIKK
jgi:2',3'-cyclic-nucleotide 2'-phosphodiesterase (5'-nucleotidase family)